MCSQGAYRVGNSAAVSVYLQDRGTCGTPVIYFSFPSEIILSSFTACVLVVVFMPFWFSTVVTGWRG